MISASWQGAVANSGSIGIFIGVLINGWLTEKFGHRKILLYCYVLLTALIFIPFFAPSLGVLVAGEILCGLCWGQFSITVRPTPRRIRRSRKPSLSPSFACHPGRSEAKTRPTPERRFRRSRIFALRARPG